MFKVTWARLCVFGRMHSRVHVFDIRTTECTFSDERVARQFVTHCSNGRAAMRFVMHGYGGRAARQFVAHDSGGRAAQRFMARLEQVRGSAVRGARFSRDARIGCARAKLYGWLSLVDEL